jgi:diaminopimelate epimerase
MKIKVTYMSGAGNLFTVIDNTASIISEKQGKALAPILCSVNEKNKIETEGLMLLEQSADYNFKCVFFNPDGSTGMMCGNGGRAIVKFALAKGAINNNQAKLLFEMAGSIYSAKLIDELVDLEMPNIKEYKELTLKLQGRHVNTHYIDNGSQHTVIRIDKIDLLDIVKLDINGVGREVRYNEAFGKIGSNANFYDVRDKTVHLRTYERGVEKETGACGTGAVATAITAVEESGLNFPIDIIPTSGEKLTIDKRIDIKKGTKFHLIGPAVILEEKEIEV